MASDFAQEKAPKVPVSLLPMKLDLSRPLLPWRQAIDPALGYGFPELLPLMRAEQRGDQRELLSGEKIDQPCPKLWLNILVDAHYCEQPSVIDLQQLKLFDFRGKRSASFLF